MDPVLLRALAVAGGIALVALVGVLLRRRDGRLRVVAPAAGAPPAGREVAAEATADAPRLAPHHLDAVGLDLDGAAAGAVLLGSPTCTPCDAVKRVLGEVADDRAGFRWVYADAGDHLDLSRELRVLRVPTLLVVDAEGRLLARSSGVPSVGDLHAVLEARGTDGEVAAAEDAAAEDDAAEDDAAEDDAAA